MCSYYWLERRSPCESRPHTHEKTIPERYPNDTPFGQKLALEPKDHLESRVAPPLPQSCGSVVFYIAIFIHSVSTMVALLRSRVVQSVCLYCILHAFGSLGCYYCVVMCEPSRLLCCSFCCHVPAFCQCLLVLPSDRKRSQILSMLSFYCVLSAVEPPWSIPVSSRPD